ncbi:MFS transporter [Sesbania bispinosa]|nr:MFS transporter [Sesbania bispinosa]
MRNCHRCFSKHLAGMPSFMAREMLSSFLTIYMLCVLGTCTCFANLCLGTLDLERDSTAMEGFTRDYLKQNCKHPS